MKQTTKNLDLLTIIFELIADLDDVTDIRFYVIEQEIILMINGNRSEHKSYDSAIDFLAGMVNMMKIIQDE